MSSFEYGPEDNDSGTVFITCNVDETVTIKVRSPGDLEFSEVEMPMEAWMKLKTVEAAGPLKMSHGARPPYPFCRTHEYCHGKGYCPHEFACND